MLFSAFFLAFSASIDSLGVGISYGIKKTKIKLFSILSLFISSIFINGTSIIIGHIITSFIPNNFVNILGSALLSCIGIFIIIINIVKGPICSDIDNSNEIDIKEAILLGIALSLDSISICFSASIIGVNMYIFPLLISLFQSIFLKFGIYIGKHISKISILPNNIWNIISGILLILIGIIKLI